MIDPRDEEYIRDLIELVLSEHAADNALTAAKIVLMIGIAVLSAYLVLYLQGGSAI